MLKNRILYAVLLLALLLFNLYLNNVYALLLLLTAVAVPLFSVLFSRLSRDSVSVTLTAPDLAEEEQPAQFIAELNNESVFPAAVVRGLLVVQNGLTGTSVRRKIRASVAGKASQTIRFQVENAEIGKLFATVSDLRTQDLFGLVSYPVSHIAAAELLVPPPDVSTEVVMLEALETTGESVRYSEKEKGLDVSELYDVREYLPGDDVRAIHWKLSAKSGAVTKLTITSGDETREWTFAYEGKKLRSAKETVTAGGETQEGTALTWELNGGAVTGLTRRNADGTEEIWDVTVKDGRVEQAEVTRGGETETYTYAYDAEGRVSKAVTGTGEHTFRYDEDGLLTEVD